LNSIVRCIDANSIEGCYNLVQRILGRLRN
jgi:hypothetical protein